MMMIIVTLVAHQRRDVREIKWGDGMVMYVVILTNIYSELDGKLYFSCGGINIFKSIYISSYINCFSRDAYLYIYIYIMRQFLN